MSRIRSTIQSFEAKVLGAFAVSALVVIGLSVATWKLAEDFANADRAVFHTQEVLNSIGHTASYTLQIELITQTFRVTGDAELLRERDAVVASRQAAVARLVGLTVDDPYQQQRLVQLQAILQQRLAIFRRYEEILAAQGRATATDYARSAPLKETREQVSRILDEMEAEERKLLDKRFADQMRSRNGLVSTGALAAGALVLLLLATYGFIRRQLRLTAGIQDALAASEKSYAATLQSIGDAVVATDTQSRIVRMNTVAERLTGWTLPEAKGRKVEEVFHIFHEKTGVPAVIPVAEVLASGEIRELANHTVLIARDATQRPIADSAAPIRADDGEIQGVVLVFRDVSKEHLAEQTILEHNLQLEQRVAERTQQLQESEARYRTAFMTSPDALTITSLPEGLYVDVNDGFVHTFGWSRKDALGQSSQELRIWKNLKCRQQFIKQLETQGTCENFEAEFVTRSGQVLTTLVSARTIRIDQMNCVLSLVRDISERKRAEEEVVRYRDHLQELVVERTRELEEARRSAEIASVAKSQFLANMSHEIRTPLSAITGMSRLVRRDPLSPGQLDHLNKLDAASAHLGATINNILDLSKIEAGKLELVHEPLRIDELVVHVLDILEVRAGEKNLALNCSIGTLPPNLYGDATRLRQALLNYAANALKFTEDGSISVRLDALQETDADVLIRWEVRDTGIGIEPVHFTKLFQAFEQADSSTARKYGGTGLGLTITRLLAQAMGGEVGATSALGAGSTFWFTSRLRKGAPVDPMALDLPSQDAAEFLRTRYPGTRVLLVDDDAFNLEIGRFILEDAGMVVQVAEDGHIACEMAGLATFDLILMDMQMPRMDGLDATRAIRKLPSGQTVPIIAITANAFSEDRRRCLESGMNDFITKPFDPQLLYTTILRWLKAA